MILKCRSFNFSPIVTHGVGIFFFIYSENQRNLMQNSDYLSTVYMFYVLGLFLWNKNSNLHTVFRNTTQYLPQKGKCNSTCTKRKCLINKQVLVIMYPSHPQLQNCKVIQVTKNRLVTRTISNHCAKKINFR